MEESQGKKYDWNPEMHGTILKAPVCDQVVLPDSWPDVISPGSPEALRGIFWFREPVPGSPSESIYRFKYRKVLRLITQQLDQDMQRSSLFILFVLSVAPLWASGGGPWWEYLVQAQGGLRLRQGPSTDFPVVTLIPDGSYVRDVHGMLYETLPAAQNWKANNGDWTLVYFAVNERTFSGWVHNDYLRIPDSPVAGFGCATLVRIASLKSVEPRRMISQIPRPIILSDHDIDVLLSDRSVMIMVQNLRQWDVDRWEPGPDGSCSLFSGETEQARLLKLEYSVLGSKRIFWTLERAPFYAQ